MSTPLLEHEDHVFQGEPAGVVGRGMHRQHMIVATISAVVSAIVHIGLLAYFIAAPMRVGNTELKLRTRHDVERQAVQVHSVDRGTFADAVQEFAGSREGMFAAPAVSDAVNTLSPASLGDGAAAAPQAYDLDAAAMQVAISEPSAALAAGQWQPRQDILAVNSVLVLDELPGLERLVIPQVTRIPDAADVVLPVEPADMILEAGRVAVAPPVDAMLGDGQDAADDRVRDIGTPVTPPTSDIESDVTGDAEIAPPSEAVKISEAATESPQDQFVESPSEITAVRPIENLLKADLEVFFDKRDPAFGYFRIAINRIDRDVLPVIPKDILIVQDSSASIAEQRLYFCRQAISGAIDHIGPKDRFNLVKFSDTAEFCFPDWASLSADAVARAQTFVAGMKSSGETDILKSLKPLLEVSREPGRPVVVLLVTDGLATTGLTRSTDIIGEFSNYNEGRISVFAMGTMMKANTYLLDLLSYCNRGDSRLTVGGRWGIPEAFDSLMTEVSQPVLTALSLRFTESASCEVYPWLTMNLFSDRPLYIYGRFPRNETSFTFQAKGEAADVDCDMIFTMDIANAKQVKDKRIRQHWAQQKIYTLIGEYARTQDPRHLSAMDHTAKRYGIKVPYRKKF